MSSQDTGKNPFESAWAQAGVYGGRATQWGETHLPGGAKTLWGVVGLLLLVLLIWAIRPGVLWRKGSFGTQSAAGSRFVESMLTVVATLKQQQCNVLEYLTAACAAALRGEAAPSLLPASAQQSQAAA